MPIEEAKKSGATALFGEKYGDTVRVVNVGGYSVEFCGGTHLHNSAEAGIFKIISESGVAAGVRRIEATTGENVLHLIEDREYMLSEVGNLIKATQGNMIQRISAIIEENKQLSKEVEALKAKMSGGAADEIINNKTDINGVSLVCGEVKDLEMNDLRSMGDKLKDKLSGEAAVIVLASGVGSKVSFVVMCTDDAVKKGAKAGDIVKAAATVCGGGGGGRPNMAQAGGKDASKIKEALEAAKAVVENSVK